MTNLEKVEKLRATVNVSFEEAKRALEQTDWDVLDAVVLLEREGKVSPSSAACSLCETAPTQEEANGGKRRRQTFSETVDKILAWAEKIIRHGNENELCIEKQGVQVISFPVTVFVLLLVFCFWAVIPLLIIGLFCGLRYSFSGPNLGKDSINEVMGKATDVADSIKDEFKSKSAD